MPSTWFRRADCGNSPKAVELVNMRLQQSMGDLFHNRLVTARTDIPGRTDIDAPVPYRQNKHVLFGQQEGTMQRMPERVPVSYPRVRPRRPPARRWPGQHREPTAAVCPLQPGEGRPAAGVPGGQVAGVRDCGVSGTLPSGSPVLAGCLSRQEKSKPQPRLASLRILVALPNRCGTRYNFACPQPPGRGR